MECRGVQVVRLSEGPVYDIAHIGRLAGLFRQISPDLVHVHLFPSQLFAIAASRIIRPRSFKIITTEHGASNRRRSNPLLRILDRRIYRAYDQVVAVGEAAGADLASWAGCSVTVVHNGSDLESIRQSVLLPRMMIGIPDGAFLIGCVGRMEPPKDPIMVVCALARLPDNLWCVFVGDGSLLPKCRAEAERLGVSSRIVFLGSRQDVAELLGVFDLFVLSSQSEGISLSVVEAMAKGIPCLLSDIPTLRETAGDSADYFTPRDVSSLAGQIRNLSTDLSRRKALSSAGKARANLFSIEKTVASYRDLYQDVGQRSYPCPK